MKLLGWIKSAVEFIKSPAGPLQARPQGDAPPEIESRTVPQDIGPDRTDKRPERETSVEPENQPDVEVENQTSVETEGHSSLVPESHTSVETKDHASDESEASQTSVEIESRIVVEVESESLPDQEEINRRRGIVRAFFNDYWSAADDKPASFAERLDRAEGYINERVAADGEAWRLGPATRKQLGLPPSRKK